MIEEVIVLKFLMNLQEKEARPWKLWVVVKMVGSSHSLITQTFSRSMDIPLVKTMYTKKRTLGCKKNFFEGWYITFQYEVSEKLDEDGPGVPFWNNYK